MEYINQIETLYIQNNVYNINKDVILHEDCTNKNRCWNDKLISEQGKDWNIISFPYIGEEYKNELLCIGLNLNQFGGYNALDKLIYKNKCCVFYYLKKHCKKMKFGNSNYGGTLMYHRIPVYANIILSNVMENNGKVYSSNKIFIENDFNELENIYKRISFTEAVKCSPHNKDDSKPNCNMYNNCYKIFLMSEIKILKPNNILIFDKNISDCIKHDCNCGNNGRRKNMEYYKIKLFDREINVYYVIHPQARNGGNSLNNIKELYKLVNEAK